jgi:hypothetical protein
MSTQAAAYFLNVFWAVLAGICLTFQAGIRYGYAGENVPATDLTRSQLVKQANAPLSTIMQIRLSDTPITKFDHTNGQGNILAVDVTMPLPAHRILPIRHLTRLTIPACVTNQNGQSEFGDLSFIDLSLIQEKKHFLWGVGPVLVMPTASWRTAGQGKWQIGPAGGFAVNTDRLLAGVLVQNPMSVGGDPSRPRTNQMILQPFVVCQLGRGWFVRTQPPLYFDWERNNRIYPINFGVGSTFKIGPQLINWYVQPYWNITTGKSPAPQNGLTVGITFLYPHFWDRVSSLWKKDRPVPDAR